MKDSMIVTVAESGAGVIPFLKVWAMFPIAVALTAIFTHLSNRFDRERVFYLMMGGFLSFFALFAFVLYPHKESILLDDSLSWLSDSLPTGLIGLVDMIRLWPFTLFYAMAESWGAIVLFVLFWGFANQITRLGEAKRFYALFGIGANLAGIMAGKLSISLSQTSLNPNLPFGVDAWHQTLVLLISMILLSGCATIILFRWVHTNVLTDPRFYDPATMDQTPVKDRQRMSLRDSILYLMKNKYLLNIAVIVISYNVVINLVEVVWKDQLKQLYPDPIDYNIYMNKITIAIGIASTFSALFISGNAIRRCGWTFTALITPMILLTTSVGFFAFLLFKDSLNSVSGFFWGTSPLAIVVFFGGLQNTLCRGAKYSVFDATKELAFVPLSTDLKSQGKAAIDGVASRLGKCGGSVIHQGLLVFCSTLTVSAPYVAVVLFVLVFMWIGATKSLGAQFSALTSGPQPLSQASKKIGEADLATAAN